MRLLSSNRGSMFITVTIILSITLIMLGFLLSITTTDVKMSRSYMDGVRAYSIAETGAEKAMAYIVQNPGKNYPNPTATPGPTPPVDSSIMLNGYSNYSAAWSVTYNVSDLSYSVISTGKYGRSTRTLKVLLKIAGNGKIQVIEWRQE